MTGRRAEDHILEWKERYETAVRASGQLLYDWDPRTNSLVYAGEIEAFLGFTREEMAGGLDRWLALVHPDDRESFLREIAEVKAEGRPFHLTFRIVRKDGRIVHCEDRGRFVGTGEDARMSGFVMDVTARFQAEQALRESEERVRWQLDELEGIYRHAAIGLCVLDADLRWVRINQHLAEINGFTIEEHIGRRPGELVPHLAGVEPLLQHVLDTGEPAIGIELSGITPAQPGVMRHWVERWLPLENAAGQIVGINIVAEEVTERKKSEETLAGLYEELRQADRRKDEFLATLAHELRNPLAPLRNGLQLLKVAGDNRQMFDRTVGIMERQLAQMVRLIDDLLDVSRITRDKLELRREPVELAAVLQSAIESSRPTVEAAGHEVTVTLPEEPVRLDADITRLAQLFQNLINNAAKYTEPGGRIWITAERLGDEVVVRVRDTGIGIPREKLTSIFEMFEQVDQSLDRSRGGLGIGLTLVKRLAEMHGGRVEARSEGPGRGSEFIVHLPVLDPALS